jgi:hypothetical protein
MYKHSILIIWHNTEMIEKSFLSHIYSWILERISNFRVYLGLSKLQTWQRNDLHEMLEDHEGASFPYSASEVMWSKLSKKVISQLHRKGAGDIEGSVVDSWFSAHPKSSSKYYNIAVNLADHVNSLREPSLIGGGGFENHFKKSAYQLHGIRCFRLIR